MAHWKLVISILAIFVVSVLGYEGMQKYHPLKQSLAKILMSKAKNDSHLQELVKQSKAEEKQFRGCDPNCKFRRFDGTCNNLFNKHWGTPMEPQLRMLDNDYDDGKFKPRLFRGRSTALPSARDVTTTCFELDKKLGESNLANQLFVQMGQFIDHDVVSTPGANGAGDCCAGLLPNGSHPDYETGGPCFPFAVPLIDRFFCIKCLSLTRSAPFEDVAGVRQQMNSLTSFLDGSAVYGVSNVTDDDLRSFKGGELKTSPGNFLPLASGGACVIKPPATACFEAGDGRVNQFAGLMAVQTLWLREHDRIAEILADLNPHWDDQRVFQETRRIVIALIQHVTYQEWLPVALSDEIMDKFGLNSNYEYNPFQNPGIINSFAAAAFRFGHSLLIDRYRTFRDSKECISTMFFTPNVLVDGEGSGIDFFVKGLLETESANTDIKFSKGINDRLFNNVFAPGVSFDLPATNIQRARDHGIPPYEKFVEHCREVMGDYPAATPSCTSSTYGRSSDVDLYVGGLSEKQVKGGMVGPTFACIIATQFRNLRNGDRFFYETRSSVGFTSAQLKEIRKETIARVLCDNLEIGQVQRKAFQVTSPENHEINCSLIPKMNLSKWKQ